MAKDFFKRADVKFYVIELDNVANEEGVLIYEELKSMTNQRTVPNIFINSKDLVFL